MVQTNAIKSAMTLSIGEVAEVIGVSAGVLRTWEGEGLFSTGRTTGGHRVFRNNDIRRLRRIAKLYFEDGLNVAAIRRELGPSDQSPTIGASSSTSVGAKLKAIRNKQKLTLVETAQRAGVSPSFLSALERGVTGVSVETLFRLTEALGTTLPSLSGAEESQDPQKHFVAAKARQRFNTDDGSLIMEDLIPKPARMEAQISYIRPGTDSNGVYSHKGQEFLMVLEGQLSFWLEPGEFYAMKPGDTLYLHSHLEHSWKNEGKTTSMVLWVNAALPDSTESLSEAERFLKPQARPKKRAASA